jgi:hypothetical protein
MTLLLLCLACSTPLLGGIGEPAVPAPPEVPQLDTGPVADTGLDDDGNGEPIDEAAQGS